jgi:phosphatidate cytidylyltransferase
MPSATDDSVAWLNRSVPPEMLRQRVLVVAVLLPVGLWVFARGGWVYAIAVALILGLAAREYAGLFRIRGLRAATILLVAMCAGLPLARQAWGLAYTEGLLSLAALAALTWHLVDFERGAPTSGTDFAVTLSGIVYLGFVGSYLVSLRALPEGLWWLLLALPCVWIGDSAAYFVGKAIGRHKMAPRLSPKKSWEGYFAGVAAAGASGACLAALYGSLGWSGAAITPLLGLWLGLILGLLTPLGDLGISMIKREMQVKDTGHLLPGHGGVLDRIDSWLWAGVLGYYLVLLLAG